MAALTAGVALSLSACVSGAEQASQDAQLDPSELQGNLVLWDTAVVDTEAPVVRELLDGFTEAYPGIRVRYENVPEEKLEERFSKALKADKVPDVVRVPTTTTASLAKQGHLVNLTGTSVDTPDAFLPAAYGSGLVDGRLMGVPQTAEPVVMASAVGTMDRVGVGVPGSWDEVAEQVDAYAAHDAVPLQGPTSGLSVLPFVYSAGGGMLNTEEQRVLINDAPSVAGFQDAIALASAGAMRPSADEAAEADAHSALQDGEVGSILTTPGRLRSLFRSAPFVDGAGLTVSAPPGRGEEDRGTAYLGYNVAVTTASESKDAAEALVSALTSPSAQKELALGAGLAPTRPDVYEEEEISEDPLMAGYRDATVVAAPAPMIARAQWLYGPVGQEWQNMASGRTSAGAGANAIARLWLPYLPEGYKD